MKHILLFSKAPMNYLMFARVAGRLLADERVRLDIFAVGEEGQDVRALYEGMGVDPQRLVSKTTARWKKYDLYVSPDMRIVGKRARKKVHVFHGISFKGKAYSEQIRDYDHAFLIGPYQRNQFVKRGILTEDDPRMVNIGMPKTDPIVNGEFVRDEVLSSRGLPTDKPVVLYAPTWRKEASLNTMGEEILRAVGGMGDVTLLLKLHDWCLDPARNRRDWGAWLADQQEANAPWTWIRERDIVPFLATADLLISDASSTANEFLLRDRPILFMDVPELFEKYEQSIDLDTWGRKTGVVVQRPEDVPAAITAALSDPGTHSEIRRAAAADYFYNPGQATDAAHRAILNLLELTPP
ncbi:CDP-glycerol glycerophosphotransferase family protein [bacterium]|nr:CDP-glycerol glycerophosphotransferase family protein [bacterium]